MSLWSTHSNVNDTVPGEKYINQLGDTFDLTGGPPNTESQHSKDLLQNEMLSADAVTVYCGSCVFVVDLFLSVIDTTAWSDR